MGASPQVAEESQSQIMFDAKPTFLRLIADEHGQAQFVDWQLTLQPELSQNSPNHTNSVSRSRYPPQQPSSSLHRPVAATPSSQRQVDSW